MSWATPTHGDAVRVLPSVSINTQSDTRNIEYLISWLQKISLEQLIFGSGTFSKPLVFTEIYFLEKN